LPTNKVLDEAKSVEIETDHAEVQSFEKLQINIQPKDNIYF
jgi:hypothetical protein